MADEIRALQVGSLTLTVINIGDVQEDLNNWFALSAAEQARHQQLLAQPARLPIHCIHIGGPGLSILVDAGLYDYPPDAPQLIPGYWPAQDLLTGLAAAGVDRQAIQQVIITHAHGDHFNALSEVQNGHLVATFPNARCYLGQADWANAQAALGNPDSLESRTFGLLHQQGQLELVTAQRDLGSGVQILPAPGESPGHQIVRIHNQGQTAYCIGDLYHLTAEVEAPELVVRWTNGASNHISRQVFNVAALNENALIIATHIHPFGHLQRTATGYQWVDR
jgi:glyoxylase-like metal-dependent hydrolase (beta-lactamase superfamily II)